jgi:hypothetical protein
MGWFRQLLSRRRIYDDLSAEIREHLKEKIDELVAGGMSRKDASAAARREFGNLTLIEEDSRAVWGARSSGMRSEAHANEVGKPSATVAAVAVAIRPANAGNRRFADWHEQVAANQNRGQDESARETIACRQVEL